MSVAVSEANWANRTLWTGDNLDIMRGMNSDSVNLIYLDPPFNKNEMFSAPIGSEAAGASFKDAWTLNDVDLAWLGEIADRKPAIYSLANTARETHGESMQAYIIYMAVRLLEMQRILQETGSIYLHCDPTAGQYLKLLMDAVFGNQQFRNEIAWCYFGPANTPRWFPRKHDTLLFYVKNDEAGGTFNRDAVRIDYKRITGIGESSFASGDRTKEELLAIEKEYAERGKVPEDHWYDIPSGSHIPASERTGYPTQKPLALLDRIIRASSDAGDIIFDPFCGCATACVAAERLGRQWVGIDLSELAAKLVKSRLKKEMKLFFDIVHRTDIPKRTDLGELPNYRTHKHTLFGKQEGICAGCRIAFPFRNLTIDHIIPQSKSGTDHIENLQLLCSACNSLKGSGRQAELIVKLTEQGIRR